MAQLARPTSDITVGGWTDEGTQDDDGNLYTSLDEETEDGDTSYIVSNTANDDFYVGLGSVTDPNKSTGHVLHFWFRTDGSGTPERVSLQLRQNETVICSVTNQSNRSASYLDVNYTLSSEEADSITDYTALVIRGTNVNASGSEWVRVTMCCLEVPDASQEYDETGKLVTLLSVLDKSDSYTMGELGKVVTSLAGVLGGDAHAMGETSKDTLILLGILGSELQQMVEDGLTTVLTAVTGNDEYFPFYSGEGGEGAEWMQGGWGWRQG